jgi:hypothetical protein
MADKVTIIDTHPKKAETTTTTTETEVIAEPTPVVTERITTTRTVRKD